MPEHFKECVDCGFTMVGIYCYSIRHICSECGGKATCDYEFFDDYHTAV